MSMYQGIDFSRFKKVSSDKVSTTLRHNQGHEIKVAHKPLSPKFKEQLDRLPMYMAEGGDTEEDDDPSVSSAPEVMDDDPSAAPSEAPDQAPPPPTTLAPEA